MESGPIRIANRAFINLRDDGSMLLGYGDVVGLVAFRPLFDLELHHLSLRQRFVTIHLNRGERDEEVLSLLALGETIHLCCIEPLDHTLFSAQTLHSSFMIFSICRV